MNEATIFLLAAGVLLLLVLAILLRPLLRRPSPHRSPGRTGVDQAAANLAILRDELRELERSRDAGELSPADFSIAKDELQRRLLDDVGTQAAPGQVGTTATSASGRRTAIVLAIAIPLCAAIGYFTLGTPRALDPAQRQARMNPQEIDTLLQRLVERLQANPDDRAGWIMLARSYKVLGRFAEAADAFARAEPLPDGEAGLLADYAEALAQANGSFSGKPAELIARALKIAPQEPQILFLAGMAANERQDFAAVADYWGRLLSTLDPQSEEARHLSAALEQVRQRLKDAAPRPDGGAAAK